MGQKLQEQQQQNHSVSARLEQMEKDLAELRNRESIQVKSETVAPMTQAPTAVVTQENQPAFDWEALERKFESKIEHLQQQIDAMGKNLTDLKQSSKSELETVCVCLMLKFLSLLQAVADINAKIDQEHQYMTQLEQQLMELTQSLKNTRIEVDNIQQTVSTKADQTELNTLNMVRFPTVAFLFKY